MIIKQLTLDQLHTYMKNNIITQIVRNTVSNNLHICFTIKIANEPFCVDFRLHSFLKDPTYDWLLYTAYELIGKFTDYIFFKITDEDYIKLCNKLNLPDKIKNSNLEFDIAYLTNHDFEKCTISDCTDITIFEPLSDQELFDLCNTQTTN